MREEDGRLLSELNSYYRTNMNILSQYLQIVWNRFNWFTTLNIGLFSFFFTQIQDSSIHNVIPKIGIVFTLLWLFIGFLDYSSIERLKEKNKVINDKIKQSLLIDNMAKSFMIKNIKQNFLLFLVPLILLNLWLFIILK